MFTTKPLFLIFFLWLIASLGFAGSNDGYIYGTITTIDDAKYTGQIRWGKEEAFWTDHMNVSKKENNTLQYLDEETLKELQGCEPSSNSETSFLGVTLWKSNWSGYKRDLLHQFVCRFGDMSKIKVTGSHEALITLRNGETVEVKGSGYNDLGNEIRVFDEELGLINVDWDRIQDIQFTATPASFESKMGTPMTGEVFTNNGSFKGLIQWDKDERLSDDKLDGSSSDGKLSIPFGKITSIQNSGSSATVTMRSGRELKLSGTNDVNGSNKGIVVTMENGLRIHVPWDEFEKVVYDEKGTHSGPAYGAFAKPTLLKGKLNTTQGDEMAGEIRYDLDEGFDFEFIQGKKDDIEYLIPIKLIKSILPKNHEYSLVELKNGEKLLLGSSQDLGEKNQGVLVFQNSKNPDYVAWENVEKITFD